MYNIASIGGTSLDRFKLINDILNIENVTSIDQLKSLIDKNYIVVINGLKNNPKEEYAEFIDFLNTNKIHVIVDAMYEASIMKFHHIGLTTTTTLLTSNLLSTHHDFFDNVITVPYFMLQSYGLLKKVLDKQPVTIEEHLQSSKKSFLCLNGVNKPSRRFVYDYCRQNNLIKDSIFSFVNRHAGNQTIKEYPTIMLDEDIQDSDDGVTWDNDYRDSWFKDTIFNLVTESSANNDANEGIEVLWQFDKCFFPTEKTFKPIFNNHPFICIADVDYHKNLKEHFGFELYDEIWDYDFDSIKEKEPRWLKVCYQVSYYQKEGIDYNKISEKLQHNQQIFLNEEQHKKTIGNILKQIDNLYV